MAVQYDSISSWAVGASDRSTTSTGSPSRSCAWTDVPATGQPVVRRHGHVVDRHPGQRHRRQPARVGHRSPHDADGYPARAQAVEDEQRGEAVGPDGRRRGARPGRPGWSASCRPRCRGSSRRSRSAGADGELGRGGVEAVHGAQHVAGLDQQPLAGRRQRDLAARPLEQRQRRARPRARGCAATAAARRCGAGRPPARSAAPRRRPRSSAGGADRPPGPLPERYRLGHDPCRRRSWTFGARSATVGP